MAFELGRKLDYKLPAKLSIYGIEVEDNKTSVKSARKKWSGASRYCAGNH